MKETCSAPVTLPTTGAPSWVIELALREMPEDHAHRTALKRALQLVCADPRCPPLALDPEGQQTLLDLLKKLAFEDILAGNEAAYVALARARCECGWQPFSHPRIAALDAAGGEMHFILVRALGVLAHAWQVAAHPDRVALTVNDLRRSVA